jgi:hypothetical protein
VDILLQGYEARWRNTFPTVSGWPFQAAWHLLVGLRLAALCSSKVTIARPVRQVGQSYFSVPRLVADLMQGVGLANGHDDCYRRYDRHCHCDHYRHRCGHRPHYCDRRCCPGSSCRCARLSRRYDRLAASRHYDRQNYCDCCYRPGSSSRCDRYNYRALLAACRRYDH